MRDNYQYVLATHTDHEHIHNHIIFNNVNFFTGRTFETEHNQGKISERAWAEVRKLSDEICREHGLSVIEEPEKGIGASHFEWTMQKEKMSWKEQLRHDLDRIIWTSISFDDFLKKCADSGIEAVYKPDHKISLKFRAKGQQRFTRARTLGWCYMPENIKAQIAFQNQQREELFGISAEEIKTPVDSAIRAGRIINTNTEKMQSSPALERWADIQNMKNASKIINMLTELGLHDTGQITGAIFRSRAVIGSTAAQVDEISKKIQQIDEQIQHTQHFLEIEPEYKRYKSLGDFRKKLYQKKHGDFLQDYSETYSHLKKANGGSTSFKSISLLNTERDRLIHEGQEKQQVYSAEKKKFSQLEYCRAEIEKYLKNERNVQQKKRRRNDLE